LEARLKLSSGTKHGINMNTDTLINVAREPMTRLRDIVGETVGLGILDKEHLECIVVSWVPGASGLSFSFKEPYHIPLHCNAPGKAFLAALPAPELQELLGRIRLRRFTRTTITAKKALLAELGMIRKAGYAIDRAEQVEGCHCIGAAVVDKDGYPAAAIWTTGTIDRIPVEIFKKTGIRVVETAAEISRRIASATASRRSYYSGIVEQAKTYMAENVHEQLDMEKVAKHFKVGYSWFRRIFKRETGESPNSHYMNLRIAKAKKLLRSSDTPIKEIAEKLGYENQYYFSNIFRKKAGCNPTEYRKKSIITAAS
jgi:DNA-binding IclR family transcriptional regulator/AraC-like DNA-binding protein